MTEEDKKRLGFLESLVPDLENQIKEQSAEIERLREECSKLSSEIIDRGDVLDARLKENQRLRERIAELEAQTWANKAEKLFACEECQKLQEKLTRYEARVKSPDCRTTHYACDCYLQSYTELNKKLTVAEKALVTAEDLAPELIELLNTECEEIQLADLAQFTNEIYSLRKQTKKALSQIREKEGI